MGLAYLVHRLKKFLDKVGRYLPSANLVWFLIRWRKSRVAKLMVKL
jgi:hypothetical protein